MVFIVAIFNIVAFIARFILLAFSAFLILYFGAMLVCRHNPIMLPPILVGLGILLFELLIPIALINFIIGFALICGIGWLVYEALFGPDIY